jgi:hypothetical protein
LLKQDPREESKILCKNTPAEKPELGERVAALEKRSASRIVSDGLLGQFKMESTDGSVSLRTVSNMGIWLKLTTTDEAKTRAHFVLHMENGDTQIRTNEIYRTQEGMVSSVRICGPSDNIGLQAVEIYLDDVVEKKPEPKKIELSRIEVRSVSKEELSGIVEAIRAEHMERGMLGAENYSLEKLPNVLIGVNPFDVTKLKVGELFRGRAEMGTGLAIERDESYCAIHARFPRKIWERAIIVLQKEGTSEAFEGETVAGGKSFRFGFDVSELSDVKSFQIMFSN